MELTAEFGTPAARGVFAVADRKFIDRRLTYSELKLEQQRALFEVQDGQSEDLAFLCCMLNRLRPKSTDPEVTAQWLEDNLTPDVQYLASVYVKLGPRGVNRILAQLSATPQPPTPGESGSTP